MIQWFWRDREEKDGIGGMERALIIPRLYCRHGAEFKRR